MVPQGVSSIEIQHILPCLADPDKIRVIAQADGDMTEVLPYVNRLVKGCIYVHEGKTLTLKKGHRIINVFGYKVTIAKADNVEDAVATLKWLRNLLNDCWSKRDKIEPDFSRKNKVVALDILRLLPKRNCGKCGYPTCTAFAVKVSDEETVVTRCTVLLDTEYTEKAKVLFRLLRDAGYTVPSLPGGVSVDE